MQIVTRFVVVGWFLICSFGCQLEVDQAPSSALADLDAGFIEQDAELATPDAELAAPDAGFEDFSNQLQAVTLSPRVCDEEVQSLPPELFSGRRSVWLLCYTTSPASENGGLSSVVFTRRVPGRANPVDIVGYVATRSDSWTASAAISVPPAPQGYPQFNVRNIHVDGLQDFAVSRNADGSALVTRGILRLWHVYSNGSRLEYAVRPIADRCTDLVAPDPDMTGSFYPMGYDCPEDLDECPLPYSCRRYRR